MGFRESFSGSEVGIITAGFNLGNWQPDVTCPDRYFPPGLMESYLIE